MVKMIFRGLGKMKCNMGLIKPIDSTPTQVNASPHYTWLDDVEVPKLFPKIELPLSITFGVTSFSIS